MGSIKERIRAMGSELNGTLAACVIAFAVLGFVGSVLNGSLYARVAEYYGIARELSTLSSFVLFLGLFFVATRKPALLDRRLMTVAALGCAITATLVLEFALELGHGPATVVGLFFKSAASAWAATLLACGLASLRSPLAALMGIALGSALAEVVRALHPAVPYQVGIVEVLGCYILAILLLYKPASAKLDNIARSTSPANLELANPESFLQPAHGLFLCVFLFNVATGYGLTLNEVDHAPISVDITAPVLVGVALWMLLSRSREKEDQLFSFSVLLVVAGFIIAPFTFLTNLSSTNALLRIGVESFNILIWLVVLAVGRRNELALLPTFALQRSMGALGTDAGAIAGHTTNDLVGTNGDVAMLIAEVVLFAFVAFLWVGFRKFSFTATISGVASIEPSHAAAGLTEGAVPAPEAPTETSIEERCAELGAVGGLTERETEIFAMLARGRNGQYVMEHYVISRNTVKSHVKHIYAKLNVHSQQELIDLVEHV